ncbi:MAG: hypothetical protein VW683_16080, partial [Betaproteobacteria bacterium]
TSSPNANLEISGASSPQLRVTDTTNTVTAKVMSDDTSGYVGTQTNHDVHILTNNNIKVTVDTSGNVGIGTTSPAKTLTVVDTSSGNRTTPAMFQNSGGIGSEVELRLVPTPYPNEIGSTARWSAIRAINSDVGNATDLAFLTNDISTDPTERMRIDSSGNLLVGTTDTTPYNNSTNTIADRGIALLATGFISAAAYNSSALDINRTGTDGNVANFYKSGVAVGRIGARDGSITIEGAVVATLTTTTETLVYSLPDTFDAAKVIITANDGTNTSITEMLIAQDSSNNVSVTQYGQVDTGSALATYTVVHDGSDSIDIKATGASATSTTYKVVSTVF